LPSTEAIIRQFYVDDFLFSTNSHDEALVVINELPNILNGGGFDLVKWNSNNKGVLSCLQPYQRVTDLPELTLGDSCQRTLGVKWNLMKDAFLFDMVEPPDHPTRRSLLSYVASIYDPLGFIAPLVLPGKLLRQEFCRLGMGWDVSMDKCMQSSYVKRIELIRLISSIEIKRCLVPDVSPEDSYELHTFADASESGYSAVSYLRYKARDGKIYCRYLMGKARVAPLKFITIPRMELTAALIATKLSVHIVKEIDIKFDKILFWTDSAIVLSYLANTSTRFVTFIANRVGRILSVSDVTQWRHVPTYMNPADVGSRPMTSSIFSKA
ncbi:MAG: hypothetical protein ACRCS7_02470, partial [Tannerellaceae bacterium]